MNRTKRFYYCLLLYTLLCLTPVTAQNLNSIFQHIVDTNFKAHPNAVGIIVSVAKSDGSQWQYAVGVSDKKTEEKLRATQPILIASNTKPYIAATIIKLSEEKKLRIEDTIGKYISTKTLRKLRNDGYPTEKITLIHLLSHTSGIADYVDDNYFDFVNTHPQYQWSRDEQIDRAMQTGNPLAEPGDTFKYADINYLLLTEIIENRTALPFYKAVRQLLKYKELQLTKTWFAKLEPKPRAVDEQAHQYWNKYPWDATNLDPSWDLYGGGGIVATTGEMSLFFKYLFEGKIIKDKTELAKLYTTVPYNTQKNYCLGFRNFSIAGKTAYYHGGFWGTDVAYFPELQTAVSIVVLQRDEKDISATICSAIVDAIKNKEDLK